MFFRPWMNATLTIWYSNIVGLYWKLYINSKMCNIILLAWVVGDCCTLSCCYCCCVSLHKIKISFWIALTGNIQIDKCVHNLHGLMVQKIKILMNKWARVAVCNVQIHWSVYWWIFFFLFLLLYLPPINYFLKRLKWAMHMFCTILYILSVGFVFYFFCLCAFLLFTE